MYSLVFDVVYWSLGGVMLVALVAAVARSLGNRRGGTTNGAPTDATLAAALGALIALICGFAFNALRPATG